MVSDQSIYNFVTINLILHVFGTLTHMALHYQNYSFVSVVLFNILIMGSVARGIDTAKSGQPFISTSEHRTTFDSVDFIKTICANSFSYYIIVHGVLDKQATTNLIYFIPMSFQYELLLDLCHYTAHRALHSAPVLYRLIHKKHHAEHYINVYTSFSHTMLDYFITNTIPLVIASYFVPMSPLMFTIQFCFKILVEIGGHSGKFSKAGSFPQFIWLPRLFKIELTNIDHNEHHINPMVNFSKRFSIWDKVFGTYVNKN